MYSAPISTTVGSSLKSRINCVRKKKRPSASVHMIEQWTWRPMRKARQARGTLPDPSAWPTSVAQAPASGKQTIGMIMPRRSPIA